MLALVSRSGARQTASPPAVGARSRLALNILQAARAAGVRSKMTIRVKNQKIEGPFVAMPTLHDHSTGRIFFHYSAGAKCFASNLVKLAANVIGDHVSS